MSLITEGADLARPAGADARAEPSLAGVGDYVALMKPRVISLVVFTALVGLVVAPGHLNPVVGFVALLCIAIGAGAAGALNMWYDADIDAVMTRTAGRPIPAGRVTRGEALGFGMTLAVGSVAVLGLATNWLAAGLLAFTIFFYVAIYTMWLKRSTPQNIVIGGPPRAVPPLGSSPARASSGSPCGSGARMASRRRSSCSASRSSICSCSLRYCSPTTGSVTCSAAACEPRMTIMDQDSDDGIVLTEEQKRRRRAR